MSIKGADVLQFSARKNLNQGDRGFGAENTRDGVAGEATKIINMPSVWHLDNVDTILYDVEVFMEVMLRTGSVDLLREGDFWSKDSFISVEDADTQTYDMPFHVFRSLKVRHPTSQNETDWLGYISKELNTLCIKVLPIETESGIINTELGEDEIDTYRPDEIAGIGGEDDDFAYSVHLYDTSGDYLGSGDRWAVAGVDTYTLFDLMLAGYRESSRLSEGESRPIGYCEVSLYSGGDTTITKISEPLFLGIVQRGLSRLYKDHPILSNLSLHDTMAFYAKQKKISSE